MGNLLLDLFWSPVTLYICLLTGQPPTHPRASPASMDTPTTVGPISPVSSTYACEETKEGVTDSPIKNRTGAFKESLTPLLQMSDRSLEVLRLGTAEEVVSFH